MSDVTADPGPETPPTPPETPPAADPAAPPAPAEPGHSFETVDDAVAALKETRAEAASRRTEAKALKEQLGQYDDSLSGYTADEKAAVLSIFKDLANPATQAAAAKRLAEISERVLAREDGQPPSRPTGEEDPDEKPLTKKEWERLEAEKDQSRAIQEAIRAIEKEATDLGYPPESEGYTNVLAALVEPDIAGDVTKAVAKVKAYEASIVEKYRKEIEATGEKWPGAADAPASGAPADPGAGAPVTFEGARRAATAWLKSRPGASH